MVNTLRRIQETMEAQQARIKKNGHDGLSQVSKDALEHLKQFKGLSKSVEDHPDPDTSDQ